MKSCSFFGHRNTPKTPKLCDKIRCTVLNLIVNDNVDTFLFGSASSFDRLCLEVVTQIKTEYPKIKLIYYRSHYANISESYKDYLLKSYDDTLMPDRVENAGRASYVERNQAMIDASDICVFYFNPDYKPPLRKYSKRNCIEYQPKSGTQLSLNYAQRKALKNSGMKIINLFDDSIT